MKDLTMLEQLILTAIWRLGDGAYGVSIRKSVMETSKRELIYGTLYNTLDQLVRKELVYKNKGEPVAEQGGRSKMYYSLTPEGTQALQAARELQESMWKGIPGSLRNGLGSKA